MKHPAWANRHGGFVARLKAELVLEGNVPCPDCSTWHKPEGEDLRCGDCRSGLTRKLGRITR